MTAKTPSEKSQIEAVNTPAGREHWMICKTRAGKITGYLEVFLDSNGNAYSIPGASRWRDAA